MLKHVKNMLKSMFKACENMLKRHGYGEVLAQEVLVLQQAAHGLPRQCRRHRRRHERLLVGHVEQCAWPCAAAIDGGKRHDVATWALSPMKSPSLST